MGKDAMEVDFDGMLTDEDVARVERLANEAVWKNLTVKCWYPAPEELSQVGYRSKRELPWPVRIVQIPGYDSCACCGVHVARTGEVGIIKILSRTKFHAGVRLEMVCGDQAYTYISAALEQNRQVSQLLSVKVLETGDGAKKLLEALSQQKYRNGQLQEQIFCSIAQSYAGGDDVIHFEEGLEPGQLRNLADQIAQVCSGVAAVFSAAGEKCNYCLVSRGTDVSALGKAMTQALSGRGGGKPNAQQGTLQADRAAIEAFFQKWQGN
jgi:alanyl-tRNA synthetase